MRRAVAFALTWCAGYFCGAWFINSGSAWAAVAVICIGVVVGGISGLISD